MRKLLCIVLLLAAAASAQITTPNLGLTLPPHGTPNYDIPVNGNFSLLDTAFGALQHQFQGPWVSTISYTAGQQVTYLGILYSSLVSNNLGNAPNVTPLQWAIMAVGGSGIGSCTNQAVTALTLNTAPTCTTLTSAYVDSSILKAANNLSDVASAATARSNLGLGSVTNDVQTKAAIVPNTAPGAGQLLVGNAGGTAYAPVTVSGSGATITLSAAGVIAISSVAAGSITAGSNGQCLITTGGVTAWGGCTGVPTNPNAQVFTSSGTFTIPANVTRLKVTVVAGGGSGGGGSPSTVGGGGASGGAAIKWLSSLTPGNTLTVTVGTGGSSAIGAAGNAGTSSSVSSGTQTITTVTTNGGAGGNYNSQAFASGIAGPAAGTGGDVNMGGSGGGTAWNAGPNNGGMGGPSIFGGGGAGGSGANGQAGQAPGAGGGGSPQITNGAGGAGANGVVIFEWTN